MTSIHEKERTFFNKIEDKFFPIKSTSCGHTLRRLTREGLKQYCPICDLLVPDRNVSRLGVSENE
jgi:hypothetical protein